MAPGNIEQDFVRFSIIVLRKEKEKGGAGGGDLSAWFLPVSCPG